MVQDKSSEEIGSSHVNDAGLFSDESGTSNQLERRKLLLANISVKRGIRKHGKVTNDAILKKFFYLKD